MKKSEIETYMDAFMKGFWKCYDIMIDLIDDDDSNEITQEILKENTEEPKPKPKPKPEQTKPKSNAQKIDRGKVCALLDAGWSVKKIAIEMKVSEASIYNIQKEHRESKAKQEGEL